MVSQPTIKTPGILQFRLNQNKRSKTGADKMFIKNILRWILLNMKIKVFTIHKEGLKTKKYYDEINFSRLRKEFEHIKFSRRGLQYLLDNYDFSTVLDIGSGEGLHADLFLKYGKQVTALDYGESVYFKKAINSEQLHLIIADFNQYEFNRQFDCIWASHVLEHQLNSNLFLKRCFSLLKEGGLFAITVPPPYPFAIVGGHVSFWNAGLVLYNLVLSGFDCKYATVLKYDYCNITVIVEKRSIVLPCISYDKGDIEKLVNYFPIGFFEGIYGDIEQINIKQP